MTAVLHKLLELPSGTPIEISGKKGKKVGLVEIPEIFVDNTDRNRTSPFAFTGNRFEFRAVGSSANCAGAMTTLNAAVAEQLLLFKKDLDAELGKGKDLHIAVMDTLKPIIASILDVVCFDGNGYDEAWKLEAARRGLDVQTSVPEMIGEFLSPSSVEMFTTTGVYTLHELQARTEVKWETYSKKILIEAKVLSRMAVNHILPVALEYKKRLLDGLALNKEVFGNLEGCTTELETMEKLNSCLDELRKQLKCVSLAMQKADSLSSEHSKASACQEVAKLLYDLRRPIDSLEEIVDNRLWPLPKYRELLFIS